MSLIATRPSRFAMMLSSSILTIGLDGGASQPASSVLTPLDPSVEASWSDRSFTTPSEYEPGRDFRFLVHALAESHTRLLQKRDTLDLRRDGVPTGPEYVDLLREPERVADKQFVSASLIDQSKMATWEGAGLILGPPRATNLVATAYTDLGSVHGMGVTYAGPELEAYVRDMNRRHPVLATDALLAATRANHYNEVLLLGRDDRGPALELRGFFIMVDEFGRVESSSMIQSGIYIAAARLNLPVLRLVKPRPNYADEALRLIPFPGDVQVAWNHQGVRHVLYLAADSGRTRSAGDYRAWRSFGAEEVTSVANRRLFAQELAKVQAEDQPLRHALAEAAITLNADGWTVMRDGATYVPELRTPAPARATLDVYAHLMPMPVELKLDAFEDEDVRIIHFPGVENAPYDMVSWQHAGLRHVLTLKINAREYTTYARGGKVVTSAKNRGLFDRAVQRAMVDDEKLRRDLEASGISPAPQPASPRPVAMKIGRAVRSLCDRLLILKR